MDTDAHLTDLLRAAPATAYPALRELRARHHPAVLAYARHCTTGEPAARRLASEAFTLAARETARGNDPGGPWRHWLLLLSGRIAASWAADDRAGGLDAGLLLVLNTSAPGGPVPPLLAAFRTLSFHAQGLLWYGVVEREAAERTAALLGLTPEGVTYGTGRALHSLAQVCLRHRLTASDDPRCGDFRRLIEESVRPDGPRHSPDLDVHRAQCPHCATAYEEQCALRDAPRAALAEGLLPWGGTAYVMDEHEASRRLAPTAVRGPGRRVVLASAALGVAVVTLAVLLASTGGAADRGSAGAVVTGPPPAVPAVTVTATVAVPVTPSADSPSPSPSSPPSHTSAPPGPRPAPIPSPSPTRLPGATYAQVVNVATGRCLEVAGRPAEGTDVVAAPCSASPSQRWRVDSGRAVLTSYADPAFCLDTRGGVDKGVGVWTCAALDGPNGRNLRFTVEGDGTIRPAIALLSALTANDTGTLSLELLEENGEGNGDQMWRAGAV
ncbi:RICIN domain-containing protein [Streptomyces sp. NBC_01485]|uniref:RICIN domain-containing protein n=1 Tax=Streptomyces sp. NBC_01485 TaxID=2903884 RepID=UPI002E3264B7|nr:RICIN domain-containing protein [Streptomyces sp. NBC_01485]